MTRDMVTLQLARQALRKDPSVINVRSAPYNAVGDGVTDDTAAIQAAIDAATALGASWSSNTARPVPSVYASGIFKTTGTINITCPVDFSKAVFWCYQTSGVAVQVGTTSGVTQGTTFWLPQVFSKVKTINGWSQVAGTTGVRVTNLYSCRVYFQDITYFETGFWGHANGVNGSSYNEFHMQRIYGCKIQYYLAPNDTGSTATSSWFNTNLFFSGVGGMSPAEGTAVSGTRVVLVASSTWPVNDNKFYGLSLENSDNVEYMVECYGNNNVWERCRWETTGTPRVWWRTGSHSNVVTPGINSNNIQFVTDSGSYNYGTAHKLSGYATASRPTSIGINGLAADTTLQRPIYSGDGLSIRTLSFQDESCTAGVGAPESAVTANPGSVYTRTDAAGVRTNEVKYPIGDSVAATTGWAAVGGVLTAGVGYLRNTLSLNTGSSSRYIVSPNSSTQPAAASTTYTIRANTRMSVPLPMQLRVQFYTSGLVATGSLLLGDTFTPGTSFGDSPTMTVTSPSNAAWMTLTYAIIAGPANAAGDTWDLRHVIMEKGSVVGTYFDGSSASGGGATYAWTGVAQASTSTATYDFQPFAYIKTGTGNTGWKLIAPAGGVSVNAAAVDAATTMALVNQIRAALITHGILS